MPQRTSSALHTKGWSGEFQPHECRDSRSGPGSSKERGPPVLVRRALLEDPPLASVVYSVREGLVRVTEVAQVTTGTRRPLLDEPEGQVEVRAGQGPVEDLALVNPRKERIPIRESVVVLEELLLAFRSLVLHANARLWPRGIKALLNEALKHPHVDMRGVGRRTVADARGN